ncbi:hypothetical protein N7G274_000257 [Stereocaulon virgatum]|uniref:Protein kinase domain-containing protein n=1 Tax=Stereocaulon virgatum TaxID=373712 RepID=A0ABR4AUD5_9LECA
MAYELHAGVERLTPLSDDLSPTYIPPTGIPPGFDTVTNDTRSWQQETSSEKTGPPNGRRVPQPLSRVSYTDLQWGDHARDEGHARTRPIDVPPASVMGGSEPLEDKSRELESTYQDASPLEQFMRNRCTSISFHPQVTLDSGHRRPLEEPLPKLAIDTRARSSLTLQDLARHPLRSPLSRSHSEGHLVHYDKVTGESLDAAAHHEQKNTTPRSSRNQPQYPLLPTTVYSVGRAKQEPEAERGASLTSESTASPVVSEAQTPIDNMDILMSPLSSRSPFPSFSYPISLEDSSAWPKPRRQTSTSRAKSYTFERKSSARQVMGQSLRSSRRSTNSSMSPATSFLSRFAREEAVVEPDSEGQEVGEYVIGKEVGFGGFRTVKEAYTIEGDERICRAVKIVRRQVPGKGETENEAFQAEFEHEIGLWRCLGHRNILPLIEVYVTDYATFCFTKLNTGGTLFDVVKENRRGVNRDLARRYAYQLASAIRYLHEDARVVHRDIKLENCLIDRSDPDTAKDGGNLLLCDFGLAEFITSDTRPNSPDPYERASDRPPLRSIGPSETSTSIAGSLQYASPELIMSPAGFLSPVVDVWAFGVVIYALLVGDLPFQHTFQPRVQMMILAGEWDMAALEKAAGVVGYEEEVLEFVAGCLEMESDHRWTISRVLKSRWLEGCQEMLEELNESWKL